MTCVSPHNSLTPGASCPQPQVGQTEPSWQVSGSWRIGDAWQRHNVYLKYPPMVSLGLKTTCKNTLLLLLSRFSRVQLCVTPEMAAHQAPPSLGFSRQEHWSGLPFPSPMHESENWKWSRSVVSDSSRPHGLQPTRLLLPWDFPGKSTGVGCHCLLQQKYISE